MTLWDVFLGTVDLPGNVRKEKFFIVAQVLTPKYLLINSRVSRFAASNSQLRKTCYVEIASANYQFLDYNSFVCCTDAFSHFDLSQASKVGQIKEADKVRIMRSVIECKNLVQRDKLQLIQTHKEIAAPIIRNLHP